MLLYGIGRFGIEFLREDSGREVGIFATSEFISLCISGAAILLFFWRNRNEVHK